MPQNPNEIYWNSDRKMRFLFAASGFAVFFALLYYLSDVLTPFVVAFLLAYILNPLVNILQKKIKYRWVAAILVLLIVLVVCIGAAFIFVPMMIDQGVNLGRLLQKYAHNSAWKETLMKYLPDEFLEKIQNIWEEKNFEPVMNKLQNMDLLKISQSILGKILPGAVGVFSGVGRVLVWFIGLFMVALCLVLMLLDFENMKKNLALQIPKEYSEKVLQFFSSFDNIMSKYFRAQTSIAAIVGVLFAISFNIMGLPLGLPFGLFIGVLNMVPYMQIASIPIAAFLGLIYSLETGIAYWQVVLIITAIYGGVQVLQDMVITPKIMGGVLGLSPILILMSLAIWGKLLGFLGFVLAIPFTCIAIATYKSYLERNKGTAKCD
ncbi:MAG: AI-2E family transporter [Fibromonadaceae bacterium]|jgi:predicted PurR-regulated permease PerM|nr:AI-2E family transporter [Fibromonadaceae bacterium]